MYVRVWEYDVPPGRVGDFVAAYGPEGDWARLFRGGEGFLGTELYADVTAEGRFMTVDRWSDESAWGAFLDAQRAAYEALDRRLETLGADERRLVECST
jgi:heme-degrading monooxygenase HmoA